MAAPFLPHVDFIGDRGFKRDMGGACRGPELGSSARGLGAALAMLVVGLGSPARATSPPTSEAGEALALCRQADGAAREQQRALLARGLSAAERAVAHDDLDADAHFAEFCNLGKLMRLDGVGFSSLLSLRRLRRAVDRTLELAPTYPDALVGKAALLYYTPRLLGGDRAEGERLLRTALTVAPDFLDARLALARLLAARGALDEARATARVALEDAERSAGAAKQDEARHLLERLGG